MLNGKLIVSRGKAGARYNSRSNLRLEFTFQFTLAQAQNKQNNKGNYIQLEPQVF